MSFKVAYFDAEQAPYVVLFRSRQQLRVMGIGKVA